MVYLAEGRARLGDRAQIAGRELRVAGFHRDSTMNSNLAMSKRLLVHAEDFEALQPYGVEERIIAFRLAEGATSGALEAAYRAADLPADGPALSATAIRILNSINGGLMVAILFLVSVFLIVLAFLCVRLILLSQMEERYRELGVMKAIGMRHRDIRLLFALRYGALSVLAALLGFVLSLLLIGPLGSTIRLQLGAGGSRGFGAVVGAGLAFLTALLVMLYVRRLFNRLRRLSASQALRGMEQATGRERTPRPRLSRGRLPLSPLLALNDLRVRRRQFGLLSVVLLCSVLLMAVPQALVHTLSSRAFVTNMGLAASDLRIDLQVDGDVAAQTQTLLRHLEADRDVARATALITHMYTVVGSDDVARPLQVELGDHEVFPLTWLTGQAPRAEDEIALSRLSADDLELHVGDSLQLSGIAGERVLRVCGIYADITNGGKTAKAAFSDDVSPALYSVIPVALHDAQLAPQKAEAWAELLPGIRVAAVERYVQTLFGPTLAAVRTAGAVALLTGLALAFLITYLFMYMLVLKDRRPIAIQKVLGETARLIVRQYLWRAGVVLLLALLLGSVITAPFSALLGGLLISASAAAMGGSVPVVWAALIPATLALAV